jgi:hypothetical protein
MFVIARFILGLGIPFAIVAASSLIGGLFDSSYIYPFDQELIVTRLCLELSHPKERAVLGSLFNSCYFIGTVSFLLNKTVF